MRLGHCVSSTVASPAGGQNGTNRFSSTRAFAEAYCCAASSRRDVDAHAGSSAPSAASVIATYSGSSERAKPRRRDSQEVTAMKRTCHFHVGAAGSICQRCSASWLEHYPVRA